jgi:hypothetical protein
MQQSCPYGSVRGGDGMTAVPTATKVRRRTEARDAPGRQGATTENIGNI